MRSLILFLLCASSVTAQYARKDGVVQLPSGQAVAGASIAVCSQPASAIITPCTPQVALYSTSTGVLPGGGTSQLSGNLAISDANGNYFYYVLPGTYTEQIYGPLIFGSFVRTDQAIGVSLASSVTAQNLVGPGTIFGSYTVTGPLSVTAPSNSSNSFSLANPGVFTNTQMNEYVQSLINGCSPQTEFQQVQGIKFSTDALTGCVAVPGAATVFQSQALAGYANTSSSTPNVAGGYMTCRVLANGGKCWGMNSVAQDLVGLTSVPILTHEFDTQPLNAPGVYSTGGVQSNLFAPTAGVFPMNAYSVGAALAGQWSNGFFVGRGAVPASGAAFISQPTCTATVSVSCQSPLWLIRSSYWTGSAGSDDTFGWQTSLGTGANPFVNLIMTHTGSTGSVSFGPQSPLNFALFTTVGNALTFALSNPSSSSNFTLTIPNTSNDTMAELNATQTMANKNLTAPTITGLTNGTGLQLFNTSTTCTTAATINTPCTTGAITLPIAYSDTNYRLSVMCLGPTQFPQVQTVSKSNTTFTITLNNLTAAAASCSSFDVSAVHN